ncbi:MAG: CYTH domain-containing protein [Patescibacteria group bacterium]|nr:CYTH domain-containing protein [Patescibacteria group bacterium]MDD5490644.1 CYTH domain-containing protein [Patescibacteria group bacterium]
MIEIEKKFILSEEDEKRLLEGAEFLGEKILDDAYFDTPDYFLTTRDIWLRSRNGRWELKLPLGKRDSQKSIDKYREIETEGAIREALGLETRESLGEGLAALGYAPFCECRTIRRKYKNGDFTIDLNSVQFADFIYTIAEIELLVGEESAAAAATEKIIRFAAEKKLKIAEVRGKVLEYLWRKKPEHYAALVKAGIISA